jgi:hypothetical protein
MRDPEPGIVPVWVNAFVHGASNEDIGAGFIGSPEFFPKQTTTTCATGCSPPTRKRWAGRPMTPAARRGCKS